MSARILTSSALTLALALPQLALAQPEWHRIELPAEETRTIQAIWGSDAQNIVAVGTGGLALTASEDGTFRIFTPDTTEDFLSVHGTGPDDVYAATATTLWHFDGLDWRPAALDIPDHVVFGNTETTGAVVTTPDGLVTGAVGYGSMIWHHTANGWQPPCTTLHRPPTHLDISSGTLIGATYDGRIGVFSDSAGALDHPACESFDNPVGTWDGLVYGVYADTVGVPVEDPRLYDMAVTAAGHVYVTGDHGTWFNPGDDRENWQQLGEDVSAGAIEVLDDGTAYLAGSSAFEGQVRMWDMVEWVDMALPPDTLGLREIWAAPDDTLFAGGMEGTLLVFTERFDPAPTELQVTAAEIADRPLDCREADCSAVAITIENPSEAPVEIIDLRADFDTSFAQTDFGELACNFDAPAHISDGFSCDWFTGVVVPAGESWTVVVGLQSADGVEYRDEPRIQVEVTGVFANGDVHVVPATTRIGIADFQLSLGDFDGTHWAVTLRNDGPSQGVYYDRYGVRWTVPAKSERPLYVAPSDMPFRLVPDDRIDPDLSDNIVGTFIGEDPDAVEPRDCDTSGGGAGMLALLAALGLVRRRAASH